MSNEIQIFNNPEFGQIRTAGTSDNPLFCLTDICKVLELQPSRVKGRLEDGVTSSNPIVDSLGREQLAVFVNEDGLSGSHVAYEYYAVHLCVRVVVISS